MYEAEKLASAQHFLANMRKAADPTVFRFELSVYLSEARSVLQYAHKEATQTPDGQRWYDGSIAASDVVRFFRALRNESVHAAPIAPHNDTTVGVITGFSLGMAGPAPARLPQITMSYAYRFSEDPAGRDALVVASEYLVALRAIVADGQAKGFLTP